MADTQNVTLSLPRQLLRQIKRVADRDTSVSALMMEALSKLAERDRRYHAECTRNLRAMKAAVSLGTKGQRTGSRDDLHER